MKRVAHIFVRIILQNSFAKKIYRPTLHRNVEETFSFILQIRLSPKECVGHRGENLSGKNKVETILFFPYKSHMSNRNLWNTVQKNEGKKDNKNEFLKLYTENEVYSHTYTYIYIFKENIYK